MMKHIRQYITIFGFVIGTSILCHGQNAPVTTSSTISGAGPGTISVPILVTGFSDIGAISLSLDYDYGVAQFLQGIPNPAMPSFLSGDMDLGNGYHRVSMSWFGNSCTLPDGSAIITLNFNYTGGNTPLTWYEDGSSCEYATPGGDALNDTPADSFYFSGYICGFIGDPGEIAGNDSVCQGQQGELYSVASLANITGYNWTLPEGAEIINGENTNSITVDFANGAVSGIISVFAFNPCGTGPTAELPVAVSSLPLADAGNDTTINCGTSTTLHAASGGPGSYSYHWEPAGLLVDPDVQNPQTQILTMTSVFTLTVTNLAGSCQAGDEIAVTITGGPLSVNPAAVPDGICAGSFAQLYSNAGGGSGNYSYLWTCTPPDDPPWTSTQANPLVSPDSTKLYQLEVYDGFTETNGSAGLLVSPLPTATISGGDTLCGPGNITTLPVELTGTPPWSFIYSNGITSVFVNDQYTTPYYIITGDPGTYFILELEDSNCSGPSFGTADVMVTPVPETPEITVIEDNLASGVCCGNQWYLNGEAIPGATGQILHVTENGLYFDIVTLNGCSSDTSEIVDMVVGISELKDPVVFLFPNPAKEKFNIAFRGPEGVVADVIIASMAGRVEKTLMFKSTGTNCSIPVELIGLSPGLYSVTVISEGAVSVGKLIVL